MNPTTTPEMIERWLYNQHGWVSFDQIAAQWDVTDRQLRPRGKHCGLIERFAIARSKGGYIHVSHATDEEFAAYYNSLASHIESVRDRMDHLKVARLSGRMPRPSYPVDPATGQMELA